MGCFRRKSYPDTTISVSCCPVKYKQSQYKSCLMHELAKIRLLMATPERSGYLQSIMFLALAFFSIGKGLSFTGRFDAYKRVWKLADVFFCGVIELLHFDTAKETVG